MNQFERWIVSKETLVLNEDLGDSLPAVDELLKNHTNIMNSLLAYEEQAKKLRAISQKLLESGDYNDEVIKTTIQTMNEKWAGLKASARQKNSKLEQSKLLQQFLQDCNEVNAHRGTCHVFTHTHVEVFCTPVFHPFSKLSNRAENNFSSKSQFYVTMQKKQIHGY